MARLAASAWSKLERAVGVVLPVIGEDAQAVEHPAQPARPADDPPPPGALPVVGVGLVLPAGR